MATLAELSTDNLVKRRNLLKGLLTAFSIFWVMLMGLAIYFYITKSNAKLFIPLVVFPVTLLPLFLQLNALNNEIKKRKQ